MNEKTNPSILYIGDKSLSFEISSCQLERCNSTPFLESRIVPYPTTYSITFKEVLYPELMAIIDKFRKEIPKPMAKKLAKKKVKTVKKKIKTKKKA